MPAVTIDQAVEIARAHHQAGRLTEAEGIYRQILTQQPDQPDALHLLGVVAYQKGQADASIELIRRAIAISPLVAEYHSNLGNILKEQGQLEEAIAACRQAIAINPNLPDAYNNLGNALRGMRQVEESIAACRQAIQLNPQLAEPYNNLGLALKDIGQLEEAAVASRRAIQLNPDMAEAHNNLGNILKDQGLLEEALVAYDRATTLNPSNSVFASNRVYLLHFHPRYSAQAIYEAHRQWNRQYAAPLQSTLRPHANDCSPERRLKIGYVSPDLREHPVGRFLLPLLQAHDRSQVEVFCYSHVSVPDDLTRHLQENTDTWRSTMGLSDEQLAEMIRADGIDILVDLTMHMANNRLLVFARKPAPVQVTYLAYCSTTGLDAMGYRLTDPYLDPPDSEDEAYSAIYSERSVWLPQTYWSYPAPAEAPEVGPLPALSAGKITFGCLNNFSKVTEETLRAWCALLRAVPQSRLLLHAKEGSHRRRVTDFLEREKLDAERVSFAGYAPAGGYFGTYRHIDIALDPFPYAGGTTTCDALWMGVPVVTLAGKTAVSRGGLSILSNVGLPELVARTADEYVEIAAGLAGDVGRLVGLRSSIRQRMASSPLMDGPRFARAVEAAYRQIWQRWCETEK